MLRLPANEIVEFDSASVVLIYQGGIEIEYTEVVSALKDERGSIYIKKSDGSFVEITPQFLTIEFRSSQT